MFKKIVYKLRNPLLIAAAGDQRELVVRIIRLLLKNKNAFIVSSSLKNLPFYIENSKKTVFVISGGEQLSKVDKKGLASLDKTDIVVKPFETKVAKGKGASVLEYGFEEGAELSGSDLMQKADSANLKLNYRGNTVPLWLAGEWSREQVKAVLSAILASLQLGVNLVQASQLLKNFKKEEK